MAAKFWGYNNAGKSSYSYPAIQGLRPADEALAIAPPGCPPLNGHVRSWPLEAAHDSSQAAIASVIQQSALLAQVAHGQSLLPRRWTSGRKGQDLPLSALLR